MREIIFRGKRTDNGEWCKGYLSKSRDENKRLKLCIDYIDYEEKGVMRSSIIIPETIGQFTGLNDKNGKKIFEGDILEGLCGSNKVYFDADFVCFDWENISGQLKESFSRFAYDYEIIGNIHDNPELLKVGKQE